MSDTTPQSLDRLFAAQKIAFAAEVYPTLDARLDRLRRLESAMVKNRVAIQKAVAADFGSHHTIVTVANDVVRPEVVAAKPHPVSAIESYPKDPIQSPRGFFN